MKSQSIWSWARILAGVGILALLAWQVGPDAFLRGVRMVDGATLATAFAIGVATTVGGAWRWRLVAAGLGVRLPLATAVAASYRSQFLNATLPGGVVGDMHRALRHGLDIGDVGLGVRAVVLERMAGQVVTAVLAGGLLLAFPSPIREHLPLLVLAVPVAALVAISVVLAVPRGGSRVARALRAVRSDVHNGLLTRRAWVGVIISSTLIVTGCLATFVLAARTAGATAPLTVLVPLTLLALLAMVLPLNVAGWGPREGVAAWAFAAAGLTAAQGVATAVTYGVLVLVGSLPGAAVLLVRALRPAGAAPARPARPDRVPVPADGRFP